MAMDVRAKVALGPLTTLGVGGAADELVAVETECDAIDAVREADARGVSLLVLGGGSNVLVADRGFAGRVVRVATGAVIGILVPLVLAPVMYAKLRTNPPCVAAA